MIHIHAKSYIFQASLLEIACLKPGVIPHTQVLTHRFIKSANKLSIDIEMTQYDKSFFSNPYRHDSKFMLRTNNECMLYQVSWLPSSWKDNCSACFSQFSVN